MKILFLKIVIWLSLFVPSLTSEAQTPHDSALKPQLTVEPEKSEPVRHSVHIDGNFLFEIKTRFGSFTPEKRAQFISDKVLELAHTKDFLLTDLRLFESEEGADIYVGQEILMTVTKRDAEAEDTDVHSLAVSHLQTLKEGIEAYREKRSSRSLLISAGIAIGVTFLAFLFLWVLAKFFQKIMDQIVLLKERYIPALRIKKFEILSKERITGVILFFVKVFQAIIFVSIIYFYFTIVFSLFPWTEDWAPKLLNYILTPIKTIGTFIKDFIPNLFFIIVICFVTRYLLVVVKSIFHEIEVGNLTFRSFHREWAEPTYKLVRFLIFTFALVVIFPYLPGSGSPAFQGVSVFLGLLLSLGSSSAVSNIVAGVVLTYMRPFKIGDRVKIAETMGDVLEKSLLVTRIRTIKNIDVTLPNSTVLGSHIINYSMTSRLEELGLILNTTVTIGYDVDWRIVQKLLIEAALRTPDVVQKAKPFVLQTALNDFYVSYELNCYTHSPNRMAVIYSELHKHILDVFNENGVEIMSPHYTALRDGQDSTVIGGAPSAPIKNS